MNIRYSIEGNEYDPAGDERCRAIRKLISGGSLQGQEYDLGGCHVPFIVLQRRQCNLGVLGISTVDGLAIVP